MASRHSAVLLACCCLAAAVTDITFDVLVFYNATSSGSSIALSEIENVESDNEEVRFYRCDTSEDPEAAVKAGLTSPVHVFSWTVDTGIEEIYLPFRRLFLNRYLSFLKLVPHASSILPIQSKTALLHAASKSDAQPLFVLFGEPSCPHCFKAKRVFQQAAGFFNNFITFAEVDCTTSSSVCSYMNVTTVPAFVLFSKPIVAPFTGGRSVAEFEMFFQSQKPKRKEAAEAGFVDPVYIDTAVEEGLAVDADGLALPVPLFFEPSETQGCCSEVASLRDQITALSARVSALEAKLAPNE